MFDAFVVLMSLVALGPFKLVTPLSREQTGVVKPALGTSLHLPLHSVHVLHNTGLRESGKVILDMIKTIRSSSMEIQAFPRFQIEHLPCNMPIESFHIKFESKQQIL